MDDGQTGLELEPLPSCAGEANGVTARGPKSTIHIPDYGESDSDDSDGDGAMLTEDELSDAQVVASAIDKPSDPKRWIVLVLATLAIFGPYYVFDNPAGTQQTLKEHFEVPLFLNESSTAAQNATAAQFNLDFNLLYTLYSLPNTVMPLVGGFFVDMIGFRKMTVITVTLAALGQLGFTISSELRLWSGMWASRALFGIGTESLCVAQRILVAEWFMGRELALSMGVVLAFGRLGSTINDNISALFGYCVNAYWAGFALCVLSVLSAVAVTWIDRAHENNVRTKVTEKQWAAFERSRQLRPRTRLSDICSLGLPFWLCCGMVLFCFPPVSSFNNISSQLITARWQGMGQEVSVQQVNAVVGILYAVSAVLALGMGWLVDRAGTRTVFVCAGALIVATAHMLIGQTELPVSVPLVGIGLGFSSLAAAVWPEIAFVTPRDSFGVAYGVAGAVQNSGLASVPAIVSQLQPPACSGSYTCVEDLFSCIALVGASIAAWAAILECRRKRLQQEAKAAGDAEALLQGIEEDKGWESGSQGSSASEDEVPPLMGGARKAGALTPPLPAHERAQTYTAGADPDLFRDRDSSAPVRVGARLAAPAGGPRGSRVQSANEAGARRRGHRASLTGQQEPSVQSLGAFLEHSTHDLRARSSSTSHDMDPAGAAAAAGGSDRDTSAGTESLLGMRPNTPEMVSAAIWGYAADVTQHGARLAERHYRRSATQTSRRGSRRGSQHSSSDHHEDAILPLPTNFP